MNEFYIGSENCEAFSLWLQSRISLLGRYGTCEMELCKNWFKDDLALIQNKNGFIPTILDMTYAIFVSHLINELGGE